MTIQWCVYDNYADEVIGVWDDLDGANTFYFDNEGPNDSWGVYPYEETTISTVVHLD